MCSCPLSSGGKWFLHISVTAKLPVTENEDISNIAGLDRGLVNIVTAADQSGLTARYSGDDARKIRARGPEPHSRKKELAGQNVY